MKGVPLPRKSVRGIPVHRQVRLNTESVDNYLKAIFTLGGPEEKRVAGSALANALRIAPASVTNMLQKLAAMPVPLVEYEKHRGILLSPAGKKRALEIIRHHRLIETFLYKVLDYPIEEIHEEAERLEHFISERFEERVAAKLGYPKLDPHGHYIPAMDGRIPKQTSTLLTESAEEKTFVVDSISDRDPVVLKRLHRLGIGPGVRFQFSRRTPLGEHIAKIEKLQKTLRLSFELAAAIRVRPILK